MQDLTTWFPEGRVPSRCGLVVTAEDPLTDAAAALQRFTLQPGTGWLASTGGVSRWTGGDIASAGTPLHGEVALGDRSLLLRYANGVWRFWMLHEVPSGNDLRFDESYLSTEGKLRMAYRVYWRTTEVDGIAVYRPFAARFVGWE